MRDFQPQNLPIDEHLENILMTLQRHSCLLLKAPPGTGKTTRLPPALLRAPFLNLKQEIWTLVPRRIAAKLAAHRVATELGESLGNTVGYQFRFEKIAGPKTRLLFLTEGLLLRRLLQDPLLSRVGVICLDEFHERHLFSDLALAYVRDLQKQKRPDLKIVVMSATLETKALENFLAPCATLTLDIPHHPVKVEYLNPRTGEEIYPALIKAIQQSHQQYPQGNILVFLPGLHAIHRATEVLTQRFARQAHCLPLHGSLSAEEQEKIFTPSTLPKIILATNIAESSITLEGISTVIDSGQHRQASFNAWNGLSALRTKNISRASALQRAGRAGRTGPGLAIRLYSQHDFLSWPEFESPEIERVDLSQSLLELFSLGYSDPKHFPWFQNPHPDRLQKSLDLLKLLGALEKHSESYHLTPLGKKMVELPLSPRLSRLLFEAEAHGGIREALLTATWLSEGKLPTGDFLTWFNTHPLPARLQAIHRQLSQYFPKSNTAPSPLDPQNRLLQNLLQAFPDRIAKRLASHSNETKSSSHEEWLLCDGGSAWLPKNQVDPNDSFLLILEAQESSHQKGLKGKIHIHSWIGLDPSFLLELENSLLQETLQYKWDPNSGKVWKLLQLNYGQCLLEQSKGPAEAIVAQTVFFQEALGLNLERLEQIRVHDLLEKLQRWLETESFSTCLAQIALAKKLGGATELPEFHGNTWSDWIRNVFSEVQNLKDLEASLSTFSLLQTLPQSWASRWSNLFPQYIALPGRKQVKIHYPLGGEPYVASRLQDFVGLNETPKIFSGKLPLTAHLLAPNGRPVQVTQDLPNFWKNTYPSLKNQLARRYPRHPWP